jgi:hypothetical protein
MNGTEGATWNGGRPPSSEGELGGINVDVANEGAGVLGNAPYCGGRGGAAEP